MVLADSTILLDPVLCEVCPVASVDANVTDIEREHLIEEGVGVDIAE